MIYKEHVKLKELPAPVVVHLWHLASIHTIHQETAFHITYMYSHECCVYCLCARGELFPLSQCRHTLGVRRR